MDYSYFSRPYFYYNGNPTVHLYGYYDDLIISILLVSGVCVSLSALIWAFYVLYTHQKKGGRISAFIVLLIINDLAELLLSAVVASYVITSIVQFSATLSLKKIIEEQYITFNWSMLFRDTILRYLLITLRISGLYLHQLVALQCMLSLKKQLSSAHVFSPLCSIITCIILWLLAFGCQFLNIWLNLIFSFFPCCIIVITYILTYKASAASDHIKPGSAVLIISTLTLITFCATAGVTIVFEIATGNFNASILLWALLICLRTITDPLLCVLVSKEQLRLYKKKQMHTPRNSEMS